MFPVTDSNTSFNSFTVSYSDQSLLYSKLPYETDDNNPNPYSPFSFIDHQLYSHSSPAFLPPDYEQPVELQAFFPWIQHHEEQQPIITAYEELTMATSNNSTTTENIQGNGFAGEGTSNGINSTIVAEPAKNVVDMVRTNKNQSKKDRHSKINTAQGPRDRRMRLSLDIAKRFFGLQDMLGFDKASKTVDWLLSKSQSEINKVSKRKRSNVANSVMSDSFGANSECCDEVSEVVNKNDIFQISGEMDTENKVNKKSSSKEKKRSGKVSVSSRKDGCSTLAKESREKARARARERTKEKMMMMMMISSSTSQSQGMQADNAVHLSKMNQSISTQVQNPADLFNLGSHYIRDEDQTLTNTSYWNPSPSIFHHLQQQSSETSQQMPLGDVQCYARPWETYNYGKSNVY